MLRSKMTGHLYASQKKENASLMVIEGSDQELAEGEFHKPIEGPAASLDPSTQQGAFIRVEQESRQIGSFGRVGDLAFCLGLGDGRLYVFSPLPIELPEAFPDGFALIGQFGAEAPENAISRKMGIRVQRSNPIEMTPQPVQRWHGWIGQNLSPGLIGAVTLDDFYPEGLFAFEMIVE